MNDILKELRRNDPSQINLEGIVEFDTLMFQLFNIIKTTINRNLDLYKALYSAFDFNKDCNLEFKELLEVYLIIETEHAELNHKEILEFKNNFQIYTGGQLFKNLSDKQQMRKMTLQQFQQFCSDFGYFQLSTICNFLKISEEEIEPDFFCKKKMLLQHKEKMLNIIEETKVRSFV